MNAPPPLYSRQAPDAAATADTAPPQIVIQAPANSVNFQTGYLGADGERAAIEGEVQIKDSQPGRWETISIALRTCERAFDADIELGFCAHVLHTHRGADAFPAAFPFSLPLTPDTPEALRTPASSLTHTLTASLHPASPHDAAVSHQLVVHTTRFSSHAAPLPAAPELRTIDSPTLVQVEIPRSTFRADEPIPIYVSIPPPPRQLLVRQELRLRNVKAELVRTIAVKRGVAEEAAGVSECAEETGGPSTVRVEQARTPSAVCCGASYTSVVARSGASCRFHASRPVQLRLVLHQDDPDLRHQRDDDAPSITQTTVLHAVSFQLSIHVAVVDVSNHTERISTISFPVTIIPAPAPLPEVDEAMSIAYQKKHDRPPSRTVRTEEPDYAPHYSEGEAGPSVVVHHHGAPPPFELEPDAPPPFLESESDIMMFTAAAAAAATAPSTTTNPIWPIIPGEGFEFGFPAEEQFDGHADGAPLLHTPSTPPPTHEMSSRDVNLNDMADEIGPQLTMQVVVVASDEQQQQQQQQTVGVADHDDEEPPPPPPAMDDPSDPPPSIDSEFRSPSARHQSPPPPPPITQQSPILHPDQPPPPPPAIDLIAPSSRPPPYLVPQVNQDQQNVNRPPPYVDLEHP